MKHCQDIRTRLDDWADGLLGDVQRREVDAHCAACPECASLFDAAAREAGPDLPAARELAAGLRELAVMADRIAEQPLVERPASWRRASGAWRIAAAIALAAGLGWLMWPVGADRSAPPRVADAPLVVAPDATGSTLVAGRGEKVASRVTEFELIVHDGRVAIPVKSDDARIHVVWLYEPVGAVGESDGESDARRS